MFHTISDFTAIWQEEAKNTEKLLHAIPDKDLNEPQFPNVRTLKQLGMQQPEE